MTLSIQIRYLEEISAYQHENKITIIPQNDLKIIFSTQNYQKMGKISPENHLKIIFSTQN